MNNDEFKKLTQSLANSPKSKVSDQWIIGQSNRRRDTAEEASKKRKKLYEGNPELKILIGKKVKESFTPELKKVKSKKMKDYWANLSEEDYKLWYNKKIKILEEMKSDPIKWNDWYQKNLKAREQASKSCKKPIMTPNGVFPGLKDAAKHYGIAVGTLQTRMKNHPDKYYYITK
jgi:hypothetical protein